MNHVDENPNLALENLDDEKVTEGANFFDCLAKSKYSAKEIAALLEINNLLEMRLLAYSEAVKINGFNEREIYRNNIGRITKDLSVVMSFFYGRDVGYQQVVHIDIPPN